MLLGVTSNRAFLARVLRQESFRTGLTVSTAFIGRHFGDAASRAAAPDDRVWSLAAWLSVAAAVEADATGAAWRHWSTGRPLPNPWRLRWVAPASTDQGTLVELRGRVTLGPTGSQVDWGDIRRTVCAALPAPRTNARATVDGEVLDYRYAWDGSTLWVHTTGGEFAFECLRRAAARTGPGTGVASREVRSSINARVVDVAARAGADVAVGDRLVVLEAMKMEHEVRAVRAGRIGDVGVRVGEQVVPGHLLVRYGGET